MKPQGFAHSTAVNKNRMVTYISCLLLTQLATSWLGRKRLAPVEPEGISTRTNTRRPLRLDSLTAVLLEGRWGGINVDRDPAIRSDKESRFR